MERRSFISTVAAGCAVVAAPVLVFAKAIFSPNEMYMTVNPRTLEKLKAFDYSENPLSDDDIMCWHKGHLFVSKDSTIEVYRDGRSEPPFKRIRQ